MDMSVTQMGSHEILGIKGQFIPRIVRFKKILMSTFRKNYLKKCKYILLISWISLAIYSE